MTLSRQSSAPITSGNCNSLSRISCQTQEGIRRRFSFTVTPYCWVVKTAGELSSGIDKDELVLCASVNERKRFGDKVQNLDMRAQGISPSRNAGSESLPCSAPLASAISSSSGKTVQDQRSVACSNLRAVIEPTLQTELGIAVYLLCRLSICKGSAGPVGYGFVEHVTER